MSNPTAPTTQTTKNGSSSRKSASLNPTTAAEVELSLKDEVREFMTDIALAQAEGALEIEAKPQVIAHFLPNGVGESGYFHFQGIKVYERGRTEQSKVQESKTLEQINFEKK